jgi:hypothetical protein
LENKQRPKSAAGNQRGQQKKYATNRRLLLRSVFCIVSGVDLDRHI